MTTTTTEESRGTAPGRGAEQARAQLETIRAWHEAWQFCDNEGQDISVLSSFAQEFLNDEMDWEHDPDHENTKDAIDEMVLEDALEVKVKSDWHQLGDEADLGEFAILLCTGGPAVRIVGELENCQPMTAKLQSQDWFTPWTDYGMEYGHSISDEDTEALIWYAERFYWEQA
jgi:hypothetical protein